MPVAAHAEHDEVQRGELYARLMHIPPLGFRKRGGPLRRQLAAQTVDVVARNGRHVEEHLFDHPVVAPGMIRGHAPLVDLEEVGPRPVRGREVGLLGQALVQGLRRAPAGEGHVEVLVRGVAHGFDEAPLRLGRHGVDVLSDPQRQGRVHRLPPAPATGESAAAKGSTSASIRSPP